MNHLVDATRELAGLGSGGQGLLLLQTLASGTTLGEMQGDSREKLEALYAKAHGLYTQGKYDQALPVFGYLITHSHLDIRFHMGFGACLQMLGKHADALKYYGAASLFDLTDPAPVIHMAECLLVLGRTREARDALTFAQGQTRGEARFAAQAARVRTMLELIARPSAPRPNAAAPSTHPPSP